MKPLYIKKLIAILVATHLTVVHIPSYADNFLLQSCSTLEPPATAMVIRELEIIEDTLATVMPTNIVSHTHSVEMFKSAVESKAREIISNVEMSLRGKKLQDDGVEFESTDLGFTLRYIDTEGRRTMYKVLFTHELTFPYLDTNPTTLMKFEMLIAISKHMDKKEDNIPPIGWVITSHESHDDNAPAVWTYRFGKRCGKWEITGPDGLTPPYENSGGSVHLLNDRAELLDIRVDTENRLQLIITSWLWHCYGRELDPLGLLVVNEDESSFLGQDSIEPILKKISDAVEEGTYKYVLFKEGIFMIQGRKISDVISELRSRLKKDQGKIYQAFSAISNLGGHINYIGIRPVLPISGTQRRLHNNPRVETRSASRTLRCLKSAL